MLNKFLEKNTGIVIKKKTDKDSTISEMHRKETAGWDDIYIASAEFPEVFCTQGGKLIKDRMIF